MPVRGLQKSWADALAEAHHGARELQRALKPPEDGPQLTKTQREQPFSASLGGICDVAHSDGECVRKVASGHLQNRPVRSMQFMKVLLARGGGRTTEAITGTTVRVITAEGESRYRCACLPDFRRM